MIFEQIQLGPMQNYSYIIADEDSKEAAVVDPAWDTGKVFEFAKENKLNIKAVLMTHTHYDHSQAVSKIVNSTNAIVYVHKTEISEIKNLGVEKIKTIGEGDSIDVGKIKIKVLHTPGHTPGSVCYLVKNKLITGDTLFIEGCGRVDLGGGDIKKMWQSIERIKNMDENIEIYPGHDYGSSNTSTIKQEKANNPYLKCSSFDEFSTVR